MTTTPAAAFAAVVRTLAPNADEAQHMVQHGGKSAVTVGKAVLAALKAGRDDTEAGCAAFLKALAPAADEARDLARHGNDRQQQVSKALLAAQGGASGIDWHAKPALGKVTISTAPGDVQTVVGQPTVVRAVLKRGGDLTSAAACAWRFDGLPPAAYADKAVFPIGSAVAEAAVAVPAQAGMVDPVPFTFQVRAPFVGLDPTPPAPVRGRLLPPAVVPTRSVVSVAQGFDAVVLSPNAPTTGQAVLGRTGDTTAALVVPLTVTGLQDGDLAAPVAPAVFAAGETQAGVTLQFGPGTTGAPDRAAHLAIDASGGAFDLGTPAGFDFAVREPSVVTGKGTLTFPSAIGTVIRQATAEKTVMVEVAREGVSTHLAATIPAVDIQLPPDVLKAVGPAEFGAGQRIGHAPMVLRPYGAGLAAKPTPAKPTPAKRTPGKAALRATADFDLGANAAQDFVVQDGQDVVTGDNPFHLPGVDLGPLKFLLGMSMGWGDAAAWIKAIGRPPLCCSGGSHNGGRTATWQGVRGGDKGAIGKGTQLDIGGTNLGAAFGIIKPGAGLIVATWRSVPDNVKASDYADLANGSHDDDAYVMGWNAWLLMKAHGLRGGQLVTRLDKEYDGGDYAVSAANAVQRAAFQARFIAAVNKGYLDAGADARPRHVLGLARHDQMGALENHVPVGTNGQVMVDAIDISMHPPAQGLSALVGKSPDVQVAGVRAWIAGDYDGRPCYAPDHKDPRYSGLAVAKAHGILISNFESSPRDDGALACPISAAAWRGLFDFWSEHADMVGGVGLYNSTCLNKSLPVPGWAAGVDAFIALAQGKAG